MWVCRIAVVLLLKDRKLPKRLEQTLTYLPPATFAALVANDLIKLEAWNSLAQSASPRELWAGIVPALLPLIAAAVVVVIALKTRSLLWCCLGGVSCFALLLLLF
jgi:branched-subunit amino acid transport protein